MVTFPIKSKLGAEVKLDVSKPNLKDIIKNSVRIQASQILGSIRANYRQTLLGFDSLPSKNFYSVSAGLMGVKLDKKYRVVFYGLTINLSEQDKTMKQATPRATGVLGRLHIRGIKKNYYYGLALVYSDGLPLPVPFFGGAQPISDNFIINYTIPAAINLQYKNDNTSIYAGASADGFRSGMNYHNKRINVNHTAGQTFVQWRQRIGRTFTMRLEGGYYFYSRISVPEKDFTHNTFTVKPGPYINFGINVLFGKSVFENALSKIAF